MKPKQTNLKFYISAIIIGIMIVFGVIYLLRVNKTASASWWNDSWGYRQQLYFNNSSQTEDLINFSVMIKKDSSDTDFWAHIKNDCEDIRFVDSDGTELNYEQEQCDYVGQKYVAWVNVPQIDLSSNTDYIYLYYGNTSAINGQNITSTWNSNYMMVQHLSESPNDGVVGHYDSTSNNNDGTPNNFQDGDGGTTTATGYIDGADIFAVEDDYILINDNDNLDNTSKLTISMWVYPTLLDGNARGIISKRVASANQDAYDFFFWTNNKLNIDIDGNGNRFASNTTFAINTWYYITVVYDGTLTQAERVKVYVNNALDVTAAETSTSIPNRASNLWLGILNINYGRNFRGTLDEVKISNDAKSLEWVKASYSSENNTFVNFQTEETKPVADGLTASSTIFMGGSTSTTLLPPILYYNFDEGYGTTTYNMVSTTKNGIINSLTWTNDGKFGKALSFNGTGSVYSNNNIGISGNVAGVSLWFKTPAVTSTNVKVLLEFSPNYNNDSTFAIFYNYLDMGTFNIAMHSSAGYSVIKLHSRYDDNEWHHLVAVFDRNQSTVLDQAKVYMDGKLSSTSIVSSYNAVHTTPFTDNKIYIGSRNASSIFFNGLIDEVKIYDYALSPDQVKLDYNDGKAMILGSTGTSTSAGSEYCVPGDTSFCASPIAEYKFDEKIGTVANDTSGNNNNGTITGATWARGKIGSAMSFDGTDDYVNLTHYTLNGQGVVTYSAFIKTSNASTTGASPAELKQAVFGQLEDSTMQVGIDNGKPSIWYYNYTAPAQWVKVWANTNIADNKWHHVTYIINTTSNVWSVYVDGIIDVSSGALTGLGPIWLDAIGKSRYSARFNGFMDDVKIYNYARTPSQIAWDYNKGAPIAHYKFDECSGTTVHDKSGNGLNGTISIGASGSQSAVGTCTDSDTTHAWYNGRTGKYKSSLNFDGTDDYASSTLSKTIVGSFLSVSMWIRPTGAQTNRVVFHIGDTINNSSPWIYFRRSTPTTVEWYLNAGYRITQTVNDNTWYFMTLTYDGTTWRAYKNGAPDGIYVGASGYPGSYTWFGTGYHGYYSGQIDDVKIFNYTLTPEQIKLEYAGNALKFN